MDILEIIKWGVGIAVIVGVLSFVGWGLYKLNAGREP